MNALSDSAGHLRHHLRQCANAPPAQHQSSGALAQWRKDFFEWRNGAGATDIFAPLFAPLVVPFSEFSP